MIEETLTVFDPLPTPQRELIWEHPITQRLVGSPKSWFLTVGISRLPSDLFANWGHWTRTPARVTGRVPMRPCIAGCPPNRGPEFLFSLSEASPAPRDEPKLRVPEAVLLRRKASVSGAAWRKSEGLTLGHALWPNCPNSGRAPQKEAANKSELRFSSLPCLTACFPNFELA